MWFIFFRKTQNVVAEFLGRHGLWLAFLVALGSMSGSLFYSQIAGFPPCDLCWVQRIFMYPLVFLLGLALIRKHHHIADYALMLAVIGFGFSIYHNYIYYYNQGLNVFGYITIPMMALTGFALIITFLLFKKYSKIIN